MTIKKAAMSRAQRPLPISDELYAKVLKVRPRHWAIYLNVI